MATHLEESLQRDIDRISNTVTEMLGLVEWAFRDCIRAIETGRRQLAYSVILRDQQIDELEQEIDRLCLEFLIRQQPVGMHLRFVYATIKLNAELERIGDYAESIARQVLKLNAPLLELMRDRFRKIAELSIPMIRGSVEAFLHRDVELAKRIMEQEAEADDLRDIINAELVQHHQRGTIPLEALNPLMTIARRFERASDQAKNICEEALYVCTGEYQKHKGTGIYRVLFVDEDNGCRSQMAEAAGNALGKAKFVFGSAGLQQGTIDPRVIGFLKQKEIDTTPLNSKTIERIPNLEHYQIVILLSHEALKAFTAPPGKIVVLEWKIPDPSRSAELVGERGRAYEETFEAIQTHLQDLVQAIIGEGN